MEHWLSEYAQALSHLNRGNLPSLREHLSDTVEFRDPFNHTFSEDEFISILDDMFARLDNVRFEIHSCIQDERSGVLYWTFHASSKMTGDISFEGISQVKADNMGNVVLHYDHWDASILMERLPMVGRLIRYIRKKISHQ